MTENGEDFALFWTLVRDEFLNFGPLEGFGWLFGNSSNQSLGNFPTVLGPVRVMCWWFKTYTVTHIKGGARLDLPVQKRQISAYAVASNGTGFPRG